MKIAYFIATILFSALMLFSVVNYFFNYPMVVEGFTTLGYPTYLIYPLAIAKLLGVAALWMRGLDTLTTIAYAGFFYNILLAFFAHLMVGDGQQWGALVAFVLVAVSFVGYRKMYARAA